jgi:hypothetical protein
MFPIDIFVHLIQFFKIDEAARFALFVSSIPSQG